MQELDNLLKFTLLHITRGESWCANPQTARAEGTLVPWACVLVHSDTDLLQNLLCFGTVTLDGTQVEQY